MGIFTIKRQTNDNFEIDKQFSSNNCLKQPQCKLVRYLMNKMLSLDIYAKVIYHCSTLIIHPVKKKWTPLRNKTDLMDLMLSCLMWQKITWQKIH